VGGVHLITAADAHALAAEPQDVRGQESVGWQSDRICRCPRSVESARSASFFTATGTESPHVHAQQERKIAKFWLEPVALASSGRFSASDLRSIERIVLENQVQFLEAWNEFFGS
jgi:hypothetical protein